MRRHSSRVTLVSAMALALGALLLAPSIAAEIPDEQVSTAFNSGGEAGYQGIIINDALNRGTKVDMFSLLSGHTDSPVGDYVCSSTTAVHCKDATQFNYFAILPPCATDASKDCIAGVSAYRDGVLLGEGTYKETLYPDHKDAFQGDPSLKIPTSSEPSFWSIPAAAHSRGSDYLVSVGLNGITSPKNPRAASAFFANIYAVEKINLNGGADPKNVGAYGLACEQQSFDAQRLKVAGVVEGGQPFVQCMSTLGSVNLPGNPACLVAYNALGHCLLRDPMDTTITLKLKVRLSNEINGWIHGRLGNPEISLEPISTGGQTVTISASPLQVPIFAAGDNYLKLPPALQSAYAEKGGLSAGMWGTANANRAEGPIANRNARSEPFPYGTDSINELKLWLDYAGNKSLAAPTTWSLRTLDDREMQSASPCFKQGSGLKGIVATNSTTYSDGPPEFVDGTLSYQVASPHFLSDGATAFKGTYNLIMRSDVARCLYKFSSAPVEAKIEVISDAGVNSVATTLVNERNGWINLSAYNFEFSAPKIQVKLTQQSAPTVAPATSAPTSSAPAAAAPKGAIKTISCIKGKTIKKVIGAKPVCPKGFVKK